MPSSSRKNTSQPWEIKPNEKGAEKHSAELGGDSTLNGGKKKKSLLSSKGCKGIGELVVLFRKRGGYV